MRGLACDPSDQSCWIPSQTWVDWRKTRLTPATITFHDLAAYVVKPATLKRKCSYVEYVASGPQAPTHYVTVWWGMPVKQVLAALEQARSGV